MPDNIKINIIPNNTIKIEDTETKVTVFTPGPAGVGFVGATGIVGSTGFVGATGQTGSQGFIGATGVGATGFIGATGPAVGVKSITIENPTASEDISWFFATDAITITELIFVITGTTSVTTTVRHHTDRSNAGNEVVTGGTVANSTTTGNVVTSFNDATIPANSFVWVETTALSGTPTSLAITAYYTKD